MEYPKEDRGGPACTIRPSPELCSRRSCHPRLSCLSCLRTPVPCRSRAHTGPDSGCPAASANLFPSFVGYPSRASAPRLWLLPGLIPADTPCRAASLPHLILCFPSFIPPYSSLYQVPIHAPAFGLQFFYELE